MAPSLCRGHRTSDIIARCLFVTAAQCHSPTDVTVQWLMAQWYGAPSELTRRPEQHRGLFACRSLPVADLGVLFFWGGGFSALALIVSEI